MQFNALLLILAPFFVAPTYELPKKQLPDAHLPPQKISPGLLDRASLLKAARDQGVEPADERPNTLATLSASKPRNPNAWLEARCVAVVTTAKKLNSFNFQREMLSWCRDKGRRAGLVVHVKVKANKAYAVNCTGTSQPWTISRIGTTERLSTTSASPTFAFIATENGVEEIQFGFDNAKFSSEFVVGKCRVSALT